jgi:uncharacterized protein YggL (DUF469 family)
MLEALTVGIRLGGETNMRKRLRKKKHVGEFQEFGVELELTLREGVDFATFLEDFLIHAVEANKLAFRGRRSRKSSRPILGAWTSGYLPHEIGECHRMARCR